MSWEYGRVLCRNGNPERFKKYESNVCCYNCLSITHFKTHKSSYIVEDSNFRVIRHLCVRCFEKRKIELGKCTKLDFIQSINRRFAIQMPFIWDRDFLTD
jgi:hypothetical protein